MSGLKDIDDFFGKEATRKQASYECKYLEDITRHVESFVGKIDYVEHEVISYTVHSDILVIQPTERVPYVTLVTSGMSDQRMNVPSGSSDEDSNGLAEFVTFLPPDWFERAEDETSEDDPDWPQNIVRWYTKYIHESGSYYDWYHTTSNGTPPSAFVSNTEMSGFLLTPPTILPENAWEVTSRTGDRIRLLNIVPILPDEIEYGIENGGESLSEKLRDSGAQLIFDPDRMSCLPKRKKFFGMF